MAVRGLGCPVRFTLTAGQKGDAPQPSQPSSYGCDKCPHHLVHDLIEPTIEPGKAALKDSGLQPSDIALRPIELPNCSLLLPFPNAAQVQPLGPAYTASDGSFRAREVARNSRAES
jgi:hypothetical protein